MKKYIQSFVSQYLLTILLAAGLFVMLGALNGGVHAALQGTCTLRGGAAAVATDINHFPACSEIDAGSLGFQIPTLGDILTFAVRAFFAIAGLAALFYMLLGAFGWVTSGGDKDAIAAAREKIQAAVVGMILVVAVLAVIWTLEQVIFKRRICLGLSCSVTLPGLIESKGEGYCCVCAAEGTGTLVDIINTGEYKCQADGVGIAR